MTTLAYLIPIALFLGGIGLAAFLWALKSGQYEDLDGAAVRILSDDDDAGEPAEMPRDGPPRSVTGARLITNL